MQRVVPSIPIQTLSEELFPLFVRTRNFYVSGRKIDPFPPTRAKYSTSIFIAVLSLTKFRPNRTTCENSLQSNHLGSTIYVPLLKIARE